MRGRLLMILLLFNFVLHAQNDFRLPFRKNSTKIKFQLINNLIVIPVVVNGAKLSFILDTGIGSTIVFSVDDTISLKHKNISKIQLRGLGNDDPVEAIRSVNNVMTIGEALSINHTIYQVLDKSINFSPRMGTVIHGVIGYDFFKDFVFDINYTKEFIKVYRPESYVYKKCRKCYHAKLDLRDENKKPFVIAKYLSEEKLIDVNLLLDSGSGSSLWLFKDVKKGIRITRNSFRDFLGKGFSGNVYGQKTKIKEFHVGDFILKEVKASFPDSIYIQRMSLDDREGSLGGDILHRFNLVIDYSRQKISFKKNNFYSKPFYYNMSGLTIQHRGYTAVNDYNVSGIKKEAYAEKNEAYLGVDNMVSEQRLVVSNNFVLKPKYEISNIRCGSPANLAGLKKGDVILQVNGKNAYRYKLSDLNNLFSSEEGKKIKIKIERLGVEIKCEFYLKKII
ncbi:aspartyl protease family protein [Aquimarina sp. Aq78]|uniref:aspartyl protease family protein n=1 Tax=Aquimarina sp. Aq78 TaxID=1191889 RepID=UPI000D10FDBA|nr:aspartyl protease family protein [Aquimarina sp. Aq78]